LEHPTVQNILHNILEKYSSLVSLRIIQTDRISTPMIFGFRNPCIAVPKISLTEKEWYYILSHEVEHFFHGHLWNKAICEFLQIIYWWNPFVYLLKKQMYKALEMQVDILVTKSMNEAERIEYLECLLKIAKNCVRQVDKIALTFASEQSSILSQRFYLILNNYHEKENSKIRNIFFIIPILFIIIFSCFVVFEPYYISSEDEANTFELTSNTSYLVLNPDGGYDIYLNDEYVTTIHEIMDSIKDLTIYQNIKEAHKNEKIQ
jgi:beta-lactamase regulating signal transducer with metallopeptidase domain